MAKQLATFQGRLVLSPDEDAFLADYADRYGRVERALYADMRRAKLKAASFKGLSREDVKEFEKLRFPEAKAG